VDPRPVLYVLAEGVQGVKGLDHRVQGVDAFLGLGGGVGRLALELDLHLGDGQGPPLHQGPVGGVDHHGHIDVAEGAGLDEEDLPRTPFLSWGAEDDQLPWEICLERG